MTLLSLGFFLFLSVGAVLYYVSPMRARVCVLAVISALFYLALGWVSFVCIMAVTVVSFLVALRIEERKRTGICALLSLAVLFLILFWLALRGVSEFFGFAAPVGISFYTLRVISYLVDIRRGKVGAERNFLEYLLYTSFFPIAFLGPVVNYTDCEKMLLKPQKPCWENICGGILRVLFGVFKKTVIADTLIRPVGRISSEPERYLGVYVIILIALYSVEVYFDFSGGIDIALGAARIFGVVLPENFNKPFSAKSLAQFWNRWHITLGEWFEHYVFYPLSLTRAMQRLSRSLRRRLGVSVGKRIPLYAATLVTWALTGLWHGGALHFLVWGLVNGVLVLLSSESSRLFGLVCERHPRIFAVRERISFFAPVRVFFVIGAVRLLDVYKSVSLTFLMLASVVVRWDSYVEIVGEIPEMISFPLVFPIALGLLAVFTASKFGVKAEKICGRPFAFALCASGLLLSSLLFGSYGYGFDAADFIYSRF